MSLVRTTFPFSGGIDRSKITFRSDPGSFYDMLNFRHSVDTFGELEQTPYFTQLVQATQGTYYAAGSQTEPSTSAVRTALANLVMTDYVMWDSLDCTVQLQVFYQTTYPAAETIHTGLRLEIGSITGLGITLGSTLDVEMTGAAIFRWRKNGGVWTAGVPSITGVSIDSGNATLYFLANAGYAGTETWAWTRTDCSYENSSLVNTRPGQWVFFRDNLYFTNTQDRVMAVKASTTGNYVSSVGYRPVYATYICFFENHLFCGGYSTSAVGAGTYPRNRTWAVSDLNDVENLIATDVNEADSAILPSSPISDVVSTTSANDLILGIAEIRKQLFIFTTQEAYQTPYQGLPVPFNFTKFADYPLVEGTQTVIRSTYGVYLVGISLIVFFDGSSYKPISLPVWNLIGQTTLGASYVGVAIVGIATTFSGSSNVYYDNVRREYGFLLEKKLYVYQETFNTWYTRAFDFNSDSVPMTSLSLDSAGNLVVGTKNRKILTENTSWDVQPVYDATDGTVYTTPKITFHAIAGSSLSAVKEVSSAYLGARVRAVNTTYFSTNASLVFTLGWYLAPQGIISGAPTTASESTWINTDADGVISLPRVPFRAIAFEIQLTGTASMPPGQALVNSLEPLIYDTRPAKLETTR